MTIETSSSSVTYTGNGATTDFTYSFLIPSADDVVVSLTTVATDLVEELDPSDFSITGLDDPDGGAVTYPLSGSPLSSAYKITVQRVLPLVQETDLTNQDGFYPEVLEDALDYQTMLSQQLQEQLSRAVIAPVGTTLDVPELIALIAGAEGYAEEAAAAAATATAAAATVLAALPIGIELDWPGTAAPSLWLLEYGQVVAQATYPELFLVLGTTYNTGGEGVGNFRLPDARGIAYAGKANMGGSDKGNLPGGTVLGAILGAATVTVLQANLPSVNFLNSGITISNTLTGTVNALGAGGVGGPTAGAVTAAAPGVLNVTFGGSVAISSQGSAASGGSGTGLSVLQPTGVRNKIIFAGR